MNRSQRNLWLLATVVFAVGLTITALLHIVTQPWHILPDIGGDGAKNNLSYLYHSMYGKGYWFEGMNYPYGEHIVFTDGIPLLSVFFASIGNVSASTALTVLWWLVGLSYVLSVVYVYKILLRFAVHPLASMIFAGFITILTPQMICLIGHYALSFTCIIPMLFYWTLAYHEGRQWRYCVYIFIMGCMAAFIHPYYAGMVLIWVGVYCIGYFIFVKGRAAQKIKELWKILAAGAAVPAVVMACMKLTDTVKDRPTTPFNPPESYTNIPQIISSYYSPFWEYAVNKSLVRGAADGGEGFSYIGLVPIVVLLSSLALFIYRKIKKKQLDAASKTFAPLWLFMAFAVLVFSMGIPFIWNMQWLMDYLFIFKQFRALGRFVWIFYYIITIYSAVVMYGWFRELVAMNKKALAYSLMVLAVVVWAVEAKGYMHVTRELSRKAAYNHDVIFQKHEQNWKSFLEEHNKKGSDFQAILLLKFFHVGTEKIWVGDPGWLITLGGRAAIQLHLPIIDVMMSRSSWQQAQRQVKIAAGPYADKPMLRDIKSDKPFLLMEYDVDSLSPDQKYLLQASDYIGEFSSCRIYACYPSRIVANDKQHTDSVESILPFMGIGDTCVNCSGTWYVNHYAGGVRENGLWDNGSMPPIKGDDSVAAIIPIAGATDSIMYEYSCWFLLGSEDYRSPDVHLDLQDGDGSTIKKVIVRANESMDSRGMWFRASKYFYMPVGCRNVKCTIMNTPNPSYEAMDEMVLRSAGAVIISKGKAGMVMVNNHWFKERRR